MILEAYREFILVVRVRRTPCMCCRPSELDIVVDEDTIVEYRDTCRTDEFFLVIKAWADKDDIICLPFSGRA